MTPAEHLAEAERQLDILSNAGGEMLTDAIQARASVATAHALIAAAAELGVPHAPAATGGTGAGS